MAGQHRMMRQTATELQAGAAERIATETATVTTTEAAAAGTGTAETAAGGAAAAVGRRAVQPGYQYWTGLRR